MKWRYDKPLHFGLNVNWSIRLVLILCFLGIFMSEVLGNSLWLLRDMLISCLCFSTFLVQDTWKKQSHRPVFSCLYFLIVTQEPLLTFVNFVFAIVYLDRKTVGVRCCSSFSQNWLRKATRNCSSGSGQLFPCPLTLDVMSGLNRLEWGKCCSILGRAFTIMFLLLVFRGWLNDLREKDRRSIDSISGA